MLAELGAVLTIRDAALIWLGSNLARYIPGLGWQIGVMGAMAKRRQVPVAVSTGASLLTTLASSLTGLAPITTVDGARCAPPGSVFAKLRRL